jgi:hypothetical protein
MRGIPGVRGGLLGGYGDCGRRRLLQRMRRVAEGLDSGRQRGASTGHIRNIYPMSHRRSLSRRFPPMAAERRLEAALPVPLAVVADQNGAQVLASLCAQATVAGLRLGQPLRDATAMCPGLLTRPADPIGLAADVKAGLDRGLPALCKRLKAAGRSARCVRFEGLRTDGSRSGIGVGLGTGHGERCGDPPAVDAADRNNAGSFGLEPMAYRWTTPRGKSGPIRKERGKAACAGPAMLAGLTLPKYPRGCGGRGPRLRPCRYSPLSKQAARPSALIVSAPSMIWFPRRRT